MAVAFVALVFIAPDFRGALASGAITVYTDFRDDVFQVSPLEGIIASFGLVILVFIFLISLGYSLYLPYTKRKLDAFVFFMVFAHIIVICISNYVVYEARREPISMMFAIASFLYLFVLMFGVRFGYLQISTSEKQASSLQARIAAISVLILVAVLSIGFSLHWANCYAIAAVYAVVSAQLVERVIV